MIDSPAVAVLAYPRWLDQFGNLARQLGVTPRGVFDREQLLGEAVEIVDRPGLLHRGDCRRIDVPVGGDHQNRPRAGNPRPERAPGLGVPVAVDRVHGCAVAEEGGWHAGRGRGGTRGHGQPFEVVDTPNVDRTETIFATPA